MSRIKNKLKSLRADRFELPLQHALEPPSSLLIALAINNKVVKRNFLFTYACSPPLRLVLKTQFVRFYHTYGEFIVIAIVKSYF